MSPRSTSCPRLMALSIAAKQLANVIKMPEGDQLRVHKIKEDDEKNRN